MSEIPLWKLINTCCKDYTMKTPQREEFVKWAEEYKAQSPSELEEALARAGETVRIHEEIVSEKSVWMVSLLDGFLMKTFKSFNDAATFVHVIGWPTMDDIPSNTKPLHTNPPVSNKTENASMKAHQK